MKKKAVSVLQHIDNAFKGLHETMQKLNLQNKILEEIIDQGSESFDLRITKVEEILGAKSKHL